MSNDKMCFHTEVRELFISVPWTMSNMSFYHSRASNSKKSCTIWLKIKLIRDFMLVLVIREFDQISIENKVAVPRTTFPPLIVFGKIFHRSKASNSKENDPTWPKFELI